MESSSTSNALTSTSGTPSSTTSSVSTCRPSENWKRQRCLSEGSRPHESSKAVENDKPDNPVIVPLPVEKAHSSHSSSATCSTCNHSSSPPQPRPALWNDFLFRFKRPPTAFRHYTIPDTISVPLACRMLRSDRLLPGILGISTTDFLYNSDSTAKYVEWLSLATPDGNVFSFNLKTHGLSSELKELLLNDEFYLVGFFYSLALSRTDIDFRGKDVDFDVADCLGM